MRQSDRLTTAVGKGFWLRLQKVREEWIYASLKAELSCVCLMQSECQLIEAEFNVDD